MLADTPTPRRVRPVAGAGGRLMRRSLGGAFLCLALASCTITWNKPGMTQEEFARDEYAYCVLTPAELATLDDDTRLDLEATLAFLAHYDSWQRQRRDPDHA